MRQVCAWCGKAITPEVPSSTALVSHGICEECAGRLLLDFHRSVTDLERELAEPEPAAIPVRKALAG